MNKKPELALPAGSLQCALYAFKGGADAVYLGMHQFSARKGATNFTFEELRKLKTVCLQQNKKFYITLNTLVQDSDIVPVTDMLKQLDYIQPDGIIVQDLGIAKIIRDNFPNLRLHGSTQLAVHNTDGVKVLQKLGFERVVLSRELSFQEIKSIRNNCPDVELKVFIHGALCYGFSGLCMASQKITGRSANCGQCAQICRTWFTNLENNTDSWCFSMKDLCLEDNVKEYQKIGIDSLKVEGRMKGPEYVYYTAKYYSLLLDGKTPQDLQVQNTKDAMQTAFSRQTTKAFFNSKSSSNAECQNMICSSWPSHTGIKVGTIKKVSKNSALVHFEKPVSIRDGLFVMYKSDSAGFSLNHIEGSKTFVNANQDAVINFPSSNFKELPSTQTPVYCTSRHDLSLPLLSENISLYKKQIDINIELTDLTIKINNTDFPIELQNAKTQNSLKENLISIFGASDKSYYTLKNLSYQNNSSIKNPFVPLSVLKQIRRSFYAKSDEHFENQTINIKEPEFIIEEHKKSNSDYVLFPLNLENKDPQIPQDTNSIGLSNIGQILWAQNNPQYSYFASYFLYVQNNYAYSLLKELIPQLQGSTKNPDNNTPLFISRVCYRHNALDKPCAGCSKDNTYKIVQNNNTYKVHCKNCITTVTTD